MYSMQKYQELIVLKLLSSGDSIVNLNQLSFLSTLDSVQKYQELIDLRECNKSS